MREMPAVYLETTQAQQLERQGASEAWPYLQFRGATELRTGARVKIVAEEKLPKNGLYAEVVALETDRILLRKVDSPRA